MKVKWDIEHVYFYLVSFITLILMIVGAINLTRTAIASLTPTVYEDDRFTFEQQNLELWENKFGPELVERETSRHQEISRINYKRSLVRDLVSSLAFIVIALPIYLYHWRKIPRLEKE